MQKLHMKLLALALALTMALGTSLPAFAEETAIVADATEEAVTAVAEETPKVVTAAEEPETSREETVAPEVQPESSDAENAAPEEQPESFDAENATPAEQPESSGTETAVPEEQPESSDTETAVPAEQPESSDEETVTGETPAEEKAPADDEAAEEEAEEEVAEEENVSYTMANYGVPGLDRELTAAELNDKQALLTDGVKASFYSASVSDYEAGCVLMYTDNRTYAEEVAAALDATVVSFNYGLAELRLNSLTVEQAMAAAFDENAAIPAVYPNYLYSIVEGASNGGTKKTFGTSNVAGLLSVNAPTK